MAKFSDIIGQESIKEYLGNVLRENKISHAYIINGERSAGKEFIAHTFAMALQCEKPDDDNNPCHECHSCKQAMGYNQPDIIRITHEKPNTIGVDDIRQQINADIAIKPYNSRFKIYIMNEGEKMTVAAQNALLKTLEEPPSYAVILILTTNIHSLLPTILSRCVVLNMKPVKDDLVRKYLIETLEVPDYKAEICVAFARGNIGKARILASSEEFDNIRQEAITLLKNISDMEISELITAIKKISEYKMDVNDYLDILSVWYRDVLLFKATNDANHLIFKDEIQYIKKVADKSGYEGIETIIDALEKAKNRLNANVNFDLTLEMLLLTIKEN
ncbi:MAG: DNA polymerase III subunit [Lachnospiraceae bacterium]|nr:DNA polymerase III subunit [Lachnospiraceae bacterium]MDD3659497.1 DNA polymerase III subunit [Lachnospiraceae bacterium]